MIIDSSSKGWSIPCSSAAGSSAAGTVELAFSLVDLLTDIFFTGGDELDFSGFDSKYH